MASKKTEPFYSISKEICDIILEWIREALYVEIEEQRDQLAAYALILLEGSVMADVVGREDQIALMLNLF